ncbi:hypothetical protein LSAT2_028451, partial [Lamellibrachia satsuma]
MRELIETVDLRQTVAFLRSLRLYVDSHSSPPAPPPPSPSTLWPLVMAELLSTTTYLRTACDMHAFVDPPSPHPDLPVEDWTSDLMDSPRPSLPQRRARLSLSQRRAQRPTRFKLGAS